MIYTVIQKDWNILYRGTSEQESYDKWINEGGFQILCQENEDAPVHVVSSNKISLTAEEILTFAAELHQSITKGRLTEQSLPNYIDNYFFRAG